MSGGSYDYLCWADMPELIQKQDQLRRMSNRLARLGYAEDAANETEEIIAIIEQMRVRIMTRAKRLQGV